MSEFAPNTTRASLEVARVALGRMLGAPPAPGAPPELPVTMAVRARDAWSSVEQVLRSITGRKELAGQALLTEARRVDALDMESMHSLVALREWVERTLAPGSAAQVLTLAPTEAEKDVALNALAVLDRVEGVNRGETVAEVGSPASEHPRIRPRPASPPPSQWAPQPSAGAPSFAPPNRLSPRELEQTARANAPIKVITPDGADSAYLEPAKSSRSSALIISAVALVIILAGAGAWYALRGSAGANSSETDQGVAAYSRGSKEAARLAFVKAVEKNPNDIRALTYLGRISRDLGNLATARKYLEDAIRLDPKNALALREFASALLADQQPELARRFYVRTLEVNPDDRVSQGFLGCALMRLNRNDEAQRWFERAGTGEWSSCSAVPIAAPPISKD